MDILDIAISSITFLTTREKLILRKALTDCNMSGGLGVCPADSSLDQEKDSHVPENQNSNEWNIIKKNIDSLDKLAVISISEVSSIIGRLVKPMGWNARDAVVLARKSWALMEKQGIQGVRCDQVEFPSQLKDIFNPPYMIFYRGDLKVLEKECVSVVGTRRVCKETAQAAFDFARDASCHNVAVVSGLANGIDSFAHKGSLASGVEGTCAAVLPCGIDTIVPAGHKKLVEQMLRNGGVILSEYIPGCPAEPWRFVQRNRIIAALGQGTLVVQAPAGSGALYTADFAVECNRDLMFHSAGFCEEAQKIARDSDMRLRSGAVKNGAGKLLNNAGKFLEEGAPVVSSYEEYVSVRQSPPGTFMNKYIDQQPPLEGLD